MMKWARGEPNPPGPPSLDLAYARSGKGGEEHTMENMVFAIMRHLCHMRYRHHFRHRLRG